MFYYKYDEQHDQIDIEQIWILILYSYWSSTKSIKSSTSKFLYGWVHFCLCCSSGRYFFTHRFQNWSARYWTCRHRLRQYVSSFPKIPGGSGGLLLMRRRWFGVSGLSSLGSILSCVSGRELRMASTSVMFVANASSVRACWPRRLLRIFWTDRIILSQTPPIWLAPGGSNYWKLLCSLLALVRRPWSWYRYHWKSSLVVPFCWQIALGCWGTNLCQVMQLVLDW